MNLSKFIIYSLWFGFISNGWWILNTQELTENVFIPLGILSFTAAVGWVVMFGYLLLDEFDK